MVAVFGENPMSTATMSRTDALAKIRELEQEAADLETQFNENMSAIFQKIANAASLNASDDAPPLRNRAATAAATAPAPKHANVAKKATKEKPVSERNYSNPVGLKATIFDVLDRNPKEWAKLLPDLPADAIGLQISEIKEIIEAEGKWKSSSDDISTQLSGHLGALRTKDKVIARADGGRYYVIEGAELVVGKRGRKVA